VLLVTSGFSREFDTTAQHRWQAGFCRGQIAGRPNIQQIEIAHDMNFSRHALSHVTILLLQDPVFNRITLVELIHRQKFCLKGHFSGLSPQIHVGRRGPRGRKVALLCVRSAIAVLLRHNTHHV